MSKIYKQKYSLTQFYRSTYTLKVLHFLQKITVTQAFHDWWNLGSASKCLLSTEKGKVKSLLIFKTHLMLLSNKSKLLIGCTAL